MRFVFLPNSTGGQAAGLSRALKELGHHSETWVREQDWLQYPSDRVFLPLSPAPLLLRLVQAEIARFRMLRYLFDFDVVVYTFGSTVFCPHRSGFPGGPALWPLAAFFNGYQSLMQLLELAAAKLLGRRIVVLFQGDDARRGDFSLRNFPVSFADKVHRGYYSQMGDWIKAYQSKLFGLFADQIYFMNPDLAHVLPRRSRFMPYAHVFPEELGANAKRSQKPGILVGHAPTSRAVKGTVDVLAAVDSLRKNGVEFEFLLIENLAHSRARAVYKTVDLFVDQLLAGWYGGVAVEVMALGIPVIAYIRDLDSRFLPVGMVKDLPVQSADPRSIETVLRSLLVAKEEDLVSLGEQSREFVRKWHSPPSIAAQLLADLGIE